jgi:hypothetical protein
MSKMNREEVLRHLGGSAADVDRELRQFSDAAKVLSSRHPRLIDQHPSRWVGVYRGKVAASARTLGSLMKRLEDEGIRPRDAIIRFIDKNERTLIL